jgi:putative acetyltransferase
VFDELNIPKWVPYADPYLDLMFEEYNKPKSVYYVVENNGKVVGSAGVAPLKQQLFVNCRKCIFAGNARSGDRKSSDGCVLAKRKRLDSKIVIWKRCLLCMMPKNIQKSGFEYINAPMGSTGHVSCPVWMLKKL